MPSTKLDEFRSTFPQYDQFSDQHVLDALHAKHYSSFSREQFDAVMLGGPTDAAPLPPVPQPPVRAPQPDDTHPLVQNLAEFGKGIIPGAIQLGGLSLTGAGGMTQSGLPEAQTLQDELANIPTMTPEQVVALRKRALTELPPASAAAFNANVSNILEGDAVEDFTPVVPPLAAESIQDNPLYEAGQTVSEFGRELIPAAPGYEHSPGRMLGEGVGSLAGGALLHMVNPAVAGTAFAMAGAGEAVDRAVEAGTTEEQIMQAANMGLVPGLTDSAPLAVIMRSINVPLPLVGKFLQVVARIGATAAIEGFQEGGQAFLQNAIAQEVHSPDQSLTEGILPEAGVGAGVGAIAQTLVESFAGKRRARIRREMDDAQARASDEVARETAVDVLRPPQPTDPGVVSEPAPEGPVMPEPIPPASPEDAAAPPIPLQEPPPETEAEATPTPEPQAYTPEPGRDVRVTLPGAEVMSGRIAEVYELEDEETGVRIDLEDGTAWDGPIDEVSIEPMAAEPAPVPEAAPVEEAVRDGPVSDWIAKAREDFAQFGVGTRQMESVAGALRENIGEAAATEYTDEYQRLIDEAVAARLEGTPKPEPVPAPEAQLDESGRGAPSDRARTLAGSRSNNPSVSATRLEPSIEGGLSAGNDGRGSAVEAIEAAGVVETPPQSPILRAGEGLEGSPAPGAAETLEATLPAVRGQDGPSQAAAGEIVDHAGPQPVFRMSREEVQALSDEKQLSDDDKLLKALGSAERVRLFRKLDRARNSTNPEAADRATQRYDEQFGDLTPEQERLIFGTGETDLQTEGLQEVLDAFDTVEDFADAPVEHIGRRLAGAMRSTTPAQLRALMETGTGPADVQAAAVIIQGARQAAAGRGFGAAELDELVLDGMAQAGYSRPDAEEVLSDFREHAVRTREPVSQPRQSLPAPETDSAPTVEPIAHREVGPDVATLPDGRELPVRYAVVEASDLIASQTDDGRANAAYPQTLQPRDRGRAVSQQQITGIARALNPRLLDKSPKVSDGAPIISSDGVVESGNGRVLAVRHAYAEGWPGGKRYRRYLEQQGYPVEGVEQPILVRVRDQDMTSDERQAFTRVANQRDTLGMSATETAMADAAALSDTIIAEYRGGEVDSAQNRPFVRRFLEAAVGENELAGMVAEDGSLSQDAKRRVEAALLARAYGDAELVADLVESTDTNIRAIGGALIDVSAEWAQLVGEVKAGEIDPAMDQSQHLLEAVKTVQRARRERRNVSEFVEQREMFSGGGLHPTSEAFLRLLFRNTRHWTNPAGRGRLADALRFYVTEARKTRAGVDLLGDTAPSPETILGLAKERQYGRDEAAQSDILAQPARGAGDSVREGGRERDKAGIPQAEAARGAETEGVGGEGARTEAVDAGPDYRLDPDTEREASQQARKIERAVREAFASLGLPDRKLVTEPVLYGEGAGLTRSGAASADRRRVSGYSYRGVAYIALSGADPTSTTYHEGFHVLEQMGLFSDQETAVMERDRARLLPLAAQALAGKGDPSRLSPRELRTYAFEQYRRDREAERFTPGLIPGIRRAFGRLYDFLRRLRGILEGMGIVDASQALGAEEVFRRAASGQVGMRRHGPPSYRVREPSFVGDTGGPAYSLQPGDETVRLPSETRNLLGIDRNPVAHFDALQRRHPEYYETADQVRQDVNFVLEKPDDWFPHSDSKVVLFRESKGSGAPTVRIDLVLKRDEYRIDSVYTIDRQQIARKMRQKKEWLASRSQGGHSPGAGGIAGWFRMPPASYPSKSGITPARPSNMGKDGGDVEFSMDDDSDDAFRKRYEELFPGEPPVTAETARKSVKEGV